GLFAGVAIDGSALKMDNMATANYYQPRVALAPGQPTPVPPSALRLIEEVSKYSKPPMGGVVPAAAFFPADQPIVDNRDVQAKLATASQQLSAILDDRWKAYLALPPEVFGGPRPPSIESLAQALNRYQEVSTNPQFSNLAQRPEFAETYQLLKQMVAPP